MSETEFDVIVVGAGFAGMACAKPIAEAGFRVCVIDRKRDLGERVRTTGILVQEVLGEPLLADVPAPLLHSVPHVRLYAPCLESIRLAAAQYRFFTTDTPALMRWLGERLIAGQVELRLGCSFRDAERTSAGWHLPGIGRCRYLVGADGARSRVAERLGLGRVRDVLFGVEHEFPGAALREPDALHCFIGKRFAPGYIGWVAQTPVGVQAGLALRHRPGRTRLPDVAGFLRLAGPMTGLSPRLRDGAILIGDAAGWVSPVTAGGIHSSIRDGSIVGHALARALATAAPIHVPDCPAVPAARRKRILRWAFDHLQYDWPFDLLLATPPLRRLAERIYFNRRGDGACPADRD